VIENLPYYFIMKREGYQHSRKEAKTISAALSNSFH
jgi:hypothetical protein